MLRKLSSGQQKSGGLQPPAKPEPVENVQIPQAFSGAVTSLKDFELVKSKLHQHRHLQAPWDKSDDDIVEFYIRFKRELDRRGFPFYAHTFWRSAETQYELWRKGVTKARPGASPHNVGMAVDIVHTARHWDLIDAEWGLIGVIGKEVARKMNLSIEWGGDWGADWEASPPRRGWDPAHWELKDWRKRAARNLEKSLAGG